MSTGVSTWVASDAAGALAATGGKSIYVTSAPPPPPPPPASPPSPGPDPTGMSPPRATPRTISASSAPWNRSDTTSPDALRRSFGSSSAGGPRRGARRRVSTGASLIMENITPEASSFVPWRRLQRQEAHGFRHEPRGVQPSCPRRPPRARRAQR